MWDCLQGKRGPAPRRKMEGEEEPCAVLELPEEQRGAAEV